jgi:hypothetical protein
MGPGSPKIQIEAASIGQRNGARIHATPKSLFRPVISQFGEEKIPVPSSRDFAAQATEN